MEELGAPWQNIAKSSVCYNIKKHLEVLISNVEPLRGSGVLVGQLLMPAFLEQNWWIRIRAQIVSFGCSEFLELCKNFLS